jgi:hypothetical protein
MSQINSAAPRFTFAPGTPGKILRRFFWWADVTNRSDLKVPVFILGTQRSGTTMIFNVLAGCPECRVHWGHEKDAFCDSRIKRGTTIKRLIHKAYKKVVVFKPLNDLQHARGLLALHENARGVWVYRNFNDVVNSAVDRWSTAHRDIMRGIARGLVLHPGQDAISEGMGPDEIETVKHFCRDEISVEEGAALLWYFRNLIYFKLKLHNDPRVLLVKYEDLVTDPQRQFRKILGHVSCEFRPECIDGIFNSSIAKARAPILREEIGSLCDAMLKRLNEHYSIKAG